MALNEASSRDVDETAPRRHRDRTAPPRHRVAIATAHASAPQRHRVTTRRLRDMADVQSMVFESFVVVASLASLAATRNSEDPAAKYYRLGWLCPAVSSAIAVVYFSQPDSAIWWARVRAATSLTWRVGVPAFAPALAHAHRVPGARVVIPGAVPCGSLGSGSLECRGS